MPVICPPRSPDEPVPGSPDGPCAALAAGAPPRLVSKEETSFAPTPLRLADLLRDQSDPQEPQECEGRRPRHQRRGQSAGLPTQRRRRSTWASSIAREDSERTKVTMKWKWEEETRNKSYFLDAVEFDENGNSLEVQLLPYQDGRPAPVLILKHEKSAGRPVNRGHRGSIADATRDPADNHCKATDSR